MPVILGHSLRYTELLDILRQWSRGETPLISTQWDSMEGDVRALAGGEVPQDVADIFFKLWLKDDRQDGAKNNIEAAEYLSKELLKDE